MTYSEKECIEALEKAKQKTEGILSSTKYRKVELKIPKPDVSTLHNKYGSWNNAKQKANLETITEEESWKENDNPTNYLDIPEEAEFTEEEWKNLSKPQRYYYRNRDKIIQRASKHKAKTKKKTRKWVREYKKDLKCGECGEDRHKCLQFHHPNKEKKTKNVCKMVNDGFSLERIMEEIEKCEVLCANCHTIHHIENGYK